MQGYMGKSTSTLLQNSGSGMKILLICLVFEVIVQKHSLFTLIFLLLAFDKYAFGH